MLHFRKMEPKVLIGIPTGEIGRNAVFYDYVNLLDKPPNTLITTAHGQSPARNRNVIIEQALYAGSTHIFFLDDDILLPRDTLSRLLAHNKDVVSGLYLLRNFPHLPAIFDAVFTDGKCHHHILKEGESGLVPIVAAGLGCLLIKTELFKFLTKPYIRLGELEDDQWCDDIGFFNRLRNEIPSIEIFCDLSATMGHITSATLKPAAIEGKWYITYDTNGKQAITFPMITDIPTLENIFNDRDKVIEISS